MCCLLCVVRRSLYDVSCALVVLSRLAMIDCCCLMMAVGVWIVWMGVVCWRLVFAMCGSLLCCCCVLCVGSCC